MKMKIKFWIIYDTVWLWVILQISSKYRTLQNILSPLVIVY